MFERKDALPCLVCGFQLIRDHEDYEVQPRDGVILTSTGNYGSRVFDPIMSGDCLYFNVCDECLVRAGEQGRVKINVTYLPVQTDTPIELGGEKRVIKAIVGSVSVDRPFVPWTRGVRENNEKVYIPIDELLAGDYLENHRYSFNFDREHFELIRADVEAIE